MASEVQLKASPEQQQQELISLQKQTKASMANLFFNFQIEIETYVSEQSIVLAGYSLDHGFDVAAALKQVATKKFGGSFKKELEVLSKLILSPVQAKPGGIPLLLGFAFDLNLQKAEILTTYCGVNLDEAWMSYMQKQSLTHTLDFKQRVVNMGIQMLSSLEKLHAVGFVHQDIKLDNICVKDDNYYLIDFGYAHRLEPTSSQKKKKEFKGNSMFSSHRKFYNSDVMNPYDDIESLLYLLCYCLCGFWLPWLHDYFNQRTANEFFTKRITNCHQNNQMLYNLMPPHMVKALQYVHEMNPVTDSEKKQEKTPVDYNFFRLLLQELEYYFVSESVRQTNPERETQNDLLESAQGIKFSKSERVTHEAGCMELDQEQQIVDMQLQMIPTPDLGLDHNGEGVPLPGFYNTNPTPTPEPSPKQPPPNKLGPIMPEFSLLQKRKLKYAFVVGLYEYQKTQLEMKKASHENTIIQSNLEKETGKFIYSSAHLRDLALLKQKMQVQFMCVKDNGNGEFQKLLENSQDDKERSRHAQLGNQIAQTEQIRSIQREQILTNTQKQEYIQQKIIDMRQPQQQKESAEPEDKDDDDEDWDFSVGDCDENLLDGRVFQENRLFTLDPEVTFSQKLNQQFIETQLASQKPQQ